MSRGQWKTWMFCRGLVAGLIVSTLAVSPVSNIRADDTPVRPLWITSPKSDDSVYLYRVGTATGAVSEVRARQAAFEDALRVILDEMMARCAVDESLRPVMRNRLTVRRAEPAPGAFHVEKTSDGFSAWILVSFPLAERDQLLREITESKDGLLRILDKWQKARSAALSGEYTAALPLLWEIEREYGDIQIPAFAVEEVRLLIGDVNRELNDPISARASYDTVVGISTSAVWQAQALASLETLPPPPRLWPVNSRWGGRATAQFCVLQNGESSPVIFGALAGVLHRDFKESRMLLKDISGCDPGSVGRMFDARDVNEIATAARDIQADIALVIFAYTDTSLKGKTREVMGMQMPVPDTTVRFMVVDTAANAVVYADEFREIRGNSSDTRLAERIAAIMINNYLVPKMPPWSGL